MNFITKEELKKLFNYTMSKLNKTTNLSYDFLTLDSDADDKVVNRNPKFPLVETITSASAATINIEPLHKTTVVKQTVAEAMTINVDPVSPELDDEIVFYLANDGTQRVVTFGTGLNASGTVTGTINKTIVVRFRYDGTRFVEAGRSAAITIS